jgi:N-methylhydantoinase B
MFASDGTIHPALGVRGGSPGGPADQFKRTRTGELERLDPFGRVRLEEGETIVSITCGGGGYGDPAERDRTRVIKDVEEGWITQERAQTVYRLSS